MTPLRMFVIGNKAVKPLDGRKIECMVTNEI